jgi:hypothetical protein
MYHKRVLVGYTHNTFITNKLIIVGPNLMLHYFSLVENPPVENSCDHLKRARLGSRGPNYGVNKFSCLERSLLMLAPPDS